MPRIDQVTAFQRGIGMAALLWERPWLVEDLAEELGLDIRTTERLLAQFRRAPGVQVETIAGGEGGRGRRHRLTVMPAWLASAIRTPGRRIGASEIAGFFAYLESDAKSGRAELSLVLDCRPLLLGLVPIYLDRGGLELGIAAAQAEAARQAAGTAFAAVVTSLPSPHETAALLTPLVNLVLYVCAENAEIRDAKGDRARPENPRPRKTSAGLRIFPPDRPTTWDVASRLGAALTAVPGTAGEAQGGTHAGPRPHIRRAHWHHYWTGPRDHQEAILRWLAPVAVNVDEARPLVPTVRPVE